MPGIFLVTLTANVWVQIHGHFRGSAHVSRFNEQVLQLSPVLFYLTDPGTSEEGPERRFKCMKSPRWPRNSTEKK